MKSYFYKVIFLPKLHLRYSLKKIKMSSIFFLLMVQVLISCASFDSSSQGSKVDESLNRLTIVSEKPEPKVLKKSSLTFLIMTMSALRLN